MRLSGRIKRRIAGLAAVVTLASGVFVPAAQAASEFERGVAGKGVSAASAGTGVSGAPSPDRQSVQNLVGKVTILFERTTASKCPLTFRVHGSFEGLPAGPQIIRYRLVGTGRWKTVKVPANHGAVFTTVLETLDWDADTGGHSLQIEVGQPDGLRSNTLYYFKCSEPGAEETFGATAGTIGLTTAGGPLAELVADAYLEAVRDLSGAEIALVSRYGFREDLDAGPVTYEELWATRPSGLAVDVYELTGAQLKKVLAYRNPQGWVLTPSASLRYTVEDGTVTEITLNGDPVTDAQVVRVAANYLLAGGLEGFPRWEGATDVYRGGPDDRGALASYLVAHSPVEAPQGDRVTIR